MKRYLIFLFHVLVFVLPRTTFGQPQDLENKFSFRSHLVNGSPTSVNATSTFTESKDLPFYQNLSRGLLRTFRWWDIPFTAVTILPDKFRPEEDDDRFLLPPLAIDAELSRQFVRKDHRVSFGSNNPDIFPRAVAGLYLASISFLDLLTDVPINEKHYEWVFVFHKALIYTRTLTGATKQWFSRTRPDGSDTYSFFSGHTSITFATSAFCYRGMSDLLDEVHITDKPDLARTILKGTAFTVLYGWASYVGYSRVRDNKHYLSDVLIAAGSGTLISNLLYSLHFNTNTKDAQSEQRVKVEISPISPTEVSLIVRF